MTNKAFINTLLSSLKAQAFSEIGFSSITLYCKSILLANREDLLKLAAELGETVTTECGPDRWIHSSFMYNGWEFQAWYGISEVE